MAYFCSAISFKFRKTQSHLLFACAELFMYKYKHVSELSDTYVYTYKTTCIGIQGMYIKYAQRTNIFIYIDL